MSTRRSFIGALLATPLAAVVLPATTKKPEANAAPKSEWLPSHQPIFLPIGCDLSLCALQWAFDIAEERRLGKPKFMLIGPENKFVARELLGNYRKPYTPDSEINCLWPGFPFEVMYAMPSH